MLRRRRFLVCVAGSPCLVSSTSAVLIALALRACDTRRRADVGLRRRGAARPDRKPDAHAHRPGRAIAVPQSAARAAIAPRAGRHRLPSAAAGRQSGRRAARAVRRPRSRRCRRRAAAAAGSAASRAASLSAAAQPGAPQPRHLQRTVSDPRRLLPADGAATCSIRTRIRMRRARRVRSVSFRPASRPRRRPRSCRKKPVGARGGREAGAPLDLSTLQR